MSNIRDWLKNQLTSSRANSTAWVELTQAIADLVEKYPETFLTRLKGRQSLFEHSKEDLAVVEAELGQFFVFGNTSDEDKPSMLIQRKDEIHFKRTIKPLVNTLSREFEGMEVAWQPLYNHKEAAYCQTLRIKDGIYGDESDWWLTSRGVISINLATLSRSAQLEAIEERIEQVALPLLPMRMVMHGYLYFIILTVTEKPESVYLDDVSLQHIFENAVMDLADEIKSNGSTVGSATITPYSSIRYRLDAHPFDAYKIDSRVPTTVIETTRVEPSHVAIEVGNNLRPIYYRLDSHSFDQYPVDFQFESHGKENYNVGIDTLGLTVETSYGVEPSDSISVVSVVIEDETVATQEQQVAQSATLQLDSTSSDQWTLDQPLYDDE